MKRILVLTMCLMSTGCALTNHCDRTSIRLEYEHVSHPLAGRPFGPEREEDSLNHVGPIGRCDVGRVYTELTLGYKLADGGFYGPKLTGGVRVGVELWSR